MITKDEFDRHFRQYAKRMEIRSIRNFVFISTKDGYTCPHLDTGGCRIYHDRPINCRKFPYMMSHVYPTDRWVSIVFHDRSDCPENDRLLQSAGEAKALAL